MRDSTGPAHTDAGLKKNKPQATSWLSDRSATVFIVAVMVCSIAINLFFSSPLKSAAFAIQHKYAQRPNLVCDMDAISKEHLPVGKHHMVDLYGVQEKNIRFLEQSPMLDEVAEFIGTAGLTLLDFSAYHFDCGGITAVFLLSESHVSFHSWPEHGFVALDVYTCGKGRPEEIVDKFKDLLKPTSVRHTFLERGADRHVASTGAFNGTAGLLRDPAQTVAPLTPVVPAVIGNTAAPTTAQEEDSEPETVQVQPVSVTSRVAESSLDLCVNGDGEDDDCTLLRNVRVHADVNSKYQHIEVVDTQTLGRCMLLDRVVQFCEEDNHIYTREITQKPVLGAIGTAADKNKKLSITIIGGGDGWVASHLLDQYGDKIGSVRIVDIDQEVAKLTRAFFTPEGANSAFTDKRVHWTFGDAGAWLQALPKESEGTSDVVIIDCTDHTQEASKVLYTEEFYTNVNRLLRKGGHMVQQMNTLDEDYVPFMNTVRDQWARVGFYQLEEYTAYMKSYSGLSLFWMSQKA